MSDTYTGKNADRRYVGESVDITYNAKRCIHAAICVNRLASVFDTAKKPWISPDGAEADAVAEVVTRCPSGALHYERKDGGAAEAAPARNIITLAQDGPLTLYGELKIYATGVAIDDETRATLCRCGASENKPFCDNSHKKAQFQAIEIAPIEGRTDAQTQGGALVITAHPNGPLELAGPLEIVNAAGQTLFSGEKTWLCRCGHSSRKPFCDSTHKRIGFTAE